ncbi:hypothetical protein ABT158_50275 [Nonomuraea sp. NPDC001636]
MHLARHRATITDALVARHADVSRTFLYTNADARALMSEAQGRASTQR